jgi:hypothetical protein
MASKTLQRLMEEAPRGQPLDAEMLRDMGISPSQASYMVSSGWMVRLSKGAYLLTGDSPSSDGVIAYLSRRIPGLHVGGKTALDWQGVRHNLRFRERVVLWGRAPYEMASWVESTMLYTYQTTQLFDDGLPEGAGLEPLPNGNRSVLVSVPERALLELASDIGKRGQKGQSLEEAVNLVSSLRTLRPNVLDTFLSHCSRVKVAKLARDLGAASGYSWASNLQKHVDRLGAGKRWTSSRKGAPRLTLRP